MTSHPAATRIELSPSISPGHTHADNLTIESAKKASELLTLNHTLYHTRWKATFHSTKTKLQGNGNFTNELSDHMAHHLLALWALGATPDELQDLYDFNQPYQTSIERGDEKDSKCRDLMNPAVFNESLGKDECYAEFLHFFENEIDGKGMQAVVKEYLLKGDERANDILGRMYTGKFTAATSLSLSKTTPHRSRAPDDPSRVRARVQPAEHRRRSTGRRMRTRQLAKEVPPRDRTIHRI
jgi:hypothetical protein